MLEASVGKTEVADAEELRTAISALRRSMRPATMAQRLSAGTKSSTNRMLA